LDCDQQKKPVAYRGIILCREIGASLGGRRNTRRIDAELLLPLKQSLWRRVMSRCHGMHSIFPGWLPGTRRHFLLPVARWGGRLTGYIWSCISVGAGFEITGRRWRRISLQTKTDDGCKLLIVMEGTILALFIR
jgi:hypothetical protein